MPTIDAAGLALIKQFEGCVLTAYQDSGGIWTIGYGHTGTDVHGGMTITQAQADAYLEADVKWATEDVAALVQVVLIPNEFSALVSFEYNTGALATSPGLALINDESQPREERFEEAWGSHFCLYVKDAAGNTLPGLMRRRSAERALFFSP